MAEEIESALTPDEWAERDAGIDDERTSVGLHTLFSFSGRGPEVVEVRDDDGCTVQVPPELRHALAALALYGQPFGFTWEDVDELRTAADSDPSEQSGALYNLADRIAALLPPRQAV